MWWRLKSPVSRLFTQPFVQAQIRENSKATCHWPFWREFTSDQWIALTKSQLCEKNFHLMTSSLLQTGSREHPIYSFGLEMFVSALTLYAVLANLHKPGFVYLLTGLIRYQHIIQGVLSYIIPCSTRQTHRASYQPLCVGDEIWSPYNGRCCVVPQNT